MQALKLESLEQPDKGESLLQGGDPNLRLVRCFESRFSQASMALMLFKQEVFSLLCE
jgi:hypothetical protein